MKWRQNPSPSRLLPVLRMKRAEKDRFTTQQIFFGIFDDGVFLCNVKKNCFLGITHLSVSKWKDFDILRCSECVRPCALEIFEAEIATEPYKT